MSFRPLSRRGFTDPRFDGPQEGLPGYLRDPALTWIGGILWIEDPMSGHVANGEFLQGVQLALRLSKPFEWKRGVGQVADELVRRCREQATFALDVLDFAVQKVASTAYAEELDQILADGGSVWTVAINNGGEARLERRVPGPAAETISLIASDSERVGQHLSLAWRKLFGRDPDPSGSYREAVRAVEVAAKPIFTPEDPRATLGKIIRAIRDKPQKWELGLEGGSVEQLADMAELVWKGQKDRHGTDDPAAPLAVSREEADAALFLAIALTRLLTNGAVADRRLK